MNIGLADLIERRNHQIVDHPPGGTLGDYVPFYFTPLSMMAFNIHTGRNVRQRDGSEIVVLVSSLHRLKKDERSFLFTDRHASVAGRRFSADLNHLDRIDWKILQGRDFSRDNDDIDKTDRYQAEALVYKTVPVDSLLGIACYNTEQKAFAEKLIEDRQLDLKAMIKRGWYF